MARSVQHRSLSPDTVAPESGAGGGADALPAIQLVGVEKVFPSSSGDVHAVHQIDLDIREGEFFSLLGPSGCGKTTTLRMVAGFVEPTRGQILLQGRDMVGVPPYRRDVNMVFQQYALFPHMNVFDNVAFGLRRKKVPKAEITTRVRQMLEVVELPGKEERRPRELSGGQQQRVALARALVNRPRALLLDEPLGALDLKLRQAMQLELKRIQREVGITFVYVTHDQGEALTMSDRLVVMNEGRVEQLGTPKAVYERPASRFVAGFLGTSNILVGHLGRTVSAAAGGGEVVAIGLPASGADERLLVPAGQAAHRTGEIEVAVRPEKIVLHPRAELPGDRLCRIRGKVAEVVYLGTATNYVIATSMGVPMAVYRQNAAAIPGTEVAKGEDVWLSWLPEHSYVLGGPGEPLERALP